MVNGDHLSDQPAACRPVAGLIEQFGHADRAAVTQKPFGCGPQLSGVINRHEVLLGQVLAVIGSWRAEPGAAGWARRFYGLGERLR